MSYSPLQGRWLEEDPHGWPDGLNRYQALADSPMVKRDPTGLSPDLPIIVMTPFGPIIVGYVERRLMLRAMIASNNLTTRNLWASRLDLVADLNLANVVIRNNIAIANGNVNAPNVQMATEDRNYVADAIDGLDDVLNDRGEPIVNPGPPYKPKDERPPKPKPRIGV